MTTGRKIAAIMVTDIVGYSRMAAADEGRILARIRALRGDLVDPIVASHGGRIVKGTGDGVIAEFRSVVEAAHAAVEIQTGLAERGAGVAAEERIVFRIGVHLGDVVEEADGDLMGDGVNIAARLESICEPGGVCVSEDAFRHIHDRLRDSFVDRGEQTLKNIDRPVRAYGWKPGAVAVAPAKSRSPIRRRAALAVALIVLFAAATWYGMRVLVPAPTPPTPLASGPAIAPSPAEDKRAHAPRWSIVVLPFANFSGDAGQDYFVDGVTDILTTELARLPHTTVIASSTAFTYKNKPTDVRQIGLDLNVRYVLEGSVLRSGDRVRVNAQLIEAETGAHLWAERFDKPVADLLAMQDEIVSRLANELSTEVVAFEARRAERTANPDAMDLSFQAVALIRTGVTPEKVAKAQSLYERALQIDPTFVDALVGAASVDSLTVLFYMAQDPAAATQRAESRLAQALAAEPDNPFAHWVKGVVLCASRRAPQGVEELERALALDPSLAAAHANLGQAKLWTGRAEETEAHVQEALRLSPRDPQSAGWYIMAGASKAFLGQDEQALPWLRRSIIASPKMALGHFYLAASLANLGHLQEAESEAKAGVEADPKFTIKRFRSGAQSDNATFLAQRERVIEGMRKAGVPEG